MNCSNQNFSNSISYVVIIFFMGFDLGLKGLSPTSDQHQIFPCNINAKPIREVMRIKYMII